MSEPQLPAGSPDLSAQKSVLRDQVLAARRQLPLPALAGVAAALAGHLLAASEVRRAATVAAYVSVGREPGTGALLDGLAYTGTRVLLPVLLPDGDLDWALHDGDHALGPAGRGLLEPIGPRLGVDAVAGADVVLVPGLAVSASGDRLGRGGGSYDRALARVPVDTPVCCLLHDGELDRDVPVAPHDRPVTHAVTPREGWVRLPLR